MDKRFSAEFNPPQNGAEQKEWAEGLRLLQESVKEESRELKALMNDIVTKHLESEAQKLTVALQPALDLFNESCKTKATLFLDAWKQKKIADEAETSKIAKAQLLQLMKSMLTEEAESPAKRPRTHVSPMSSDE